MDKHALWKWLILIALTAWSLALVIPPSKKIKLGLDLKGGTSFTVQISAEEIEKQIREEFKDLDDAAVKARVPAAVKKAQEQALEIIRNRVDALGVAEPLIYPEKDNRVVVQIPGLKEQDRDRAIELIRSAAFLEFAMVHDDNDRLVKALFDKGQAPEGYKIVSLAGPDRGDYYARDSAAQPDGVMESAARAAYRARLEKFQAPPGYRFMLEEKIRDGQKIYIPYFVRQRHEMKGDALSGAGLEYDQLGRPYVSLSFDRKGARRFGQLTEDYAPGGARNPSPDGRKYMAIIMDGRLYSAPYIKTAIYGGQAVIEGNFTLAEAQGLMIVLRSGSLPAPVDIVEMRSVDPSLGRDSIESGARATIYSCIIVVLFMAGYYLLVGPLTNIGLLFNMLLLPLAMMITAGVMGLITGGAGGVSGAHIGLPVLTLPGIAGIALTIGMAVDANVLIFERIREEQQLGKRLGAAIEGGYHKAFVTILDSNLTTVLAVVILFIFGTGAVRGFGITLTAGLMVSMYSALMITRMIFNLIVAHTSLPSLKMLSLIKPTRIDFISYRKIAAAVSAVVILGAGSVVATRAWQDPSAVLGTDFTGGASLTFAFNQKQDVDKIRGVLNAAGIGQAHIQYQKLMDRPEENLHVRVPEATGGKARDALLAAFADAGLSALSEEVVGPQVGAEMTRRALWAMALSLLGMIIYISLRFRFAYAIGAVVALIHDVVVSTALFCFFGRQIDMTIVAALMTIIGFSVNDTIVIFDRIREKLKATPNAPFLQVCNLSLNETLARTILTSTTVFLAVVMLLIFGGGAINDFAFLFFIGIITGTYSTIYIATPVMIAMTRRAAPAPAGVARR